MAGSKTGIDEFRAEIDELRAEIDGLDDRIHDLLMRRTELATKVGALKRAGGENRVFMRPGREADVVRHVIGRHRGPFPKAAVFRIWREIIGGTLCVEGPLVLAVELCGGDGGPALRELARDHFGIAAPLVACAGADAVLDALAQGRANVGVLALPRPGEREPWWSALAQGRPAGLEIVARLPSLEPAGGAPARAFVLAATAFDSSGEDTTLLALEALAGIGQAAVMKALEAAGFAAEWLADDGGSRHLVGLEGFVAAEDPRFGALEAGAVVKRFRRLGGFARPLVNTP